MAWLLITLSGADADRFADALDESGALSVTIEGAGDEARLQRAREPVEPWPQSRVTGLFPEDTDEHSVLAVLRAAFGGALPPHQIDRLEDADWGRAWMAHARPLQVAPKFWITPSWCVPPDPDALNLILDPGLAFGTGTHPTTALCLGWLAAEPLAGCEFVDYGCGSGILAIAALMLGARSATGVDVDPQALAVSRENAARNRVAQRYRALTPEALGVDADVLVANILAGTLIDLAPELAARVRPAGRIALSGVLPEQAADVRRAFAPHFDLTSREHDGWILLAGKRLR